MEIAKTCPLDRADAVEPFDLFTGHVAKYARPKLLALGMRRKRRTELRRLVDELVGHVGPFGGTEEPVGVVRKREEKLAKKRGDGARCMFRESLELVLGAPDLRTDIACEPHLLPEGVTAAHIFAKAHTG